MIKLKLRRAAVGEHPAPDRDGTEVCAAHPCSVADLADQQLPYTKQELRRCQVPAQSDKTSALQPTVAVRDARPDLTPLWCPEGCGWFHSAPCYSRHHHDGWTPTPDSRAATTRPAADEPPSVLGRIFGLLLLAAVPAAAIVTLYATH